MALFDDDDDGNDDDDDGNDDDDDDKVEPARLSLAILRRLIRVVS